MDISKNAIWSMCAECKGTGKKYRRLRKKLRLRHQAALAEYEKSVDKGDAPIRPKGSQYACRTCSGSGLVQSKSYLIPNSNIYPHLAIVGGGIGGTALAVACLHRGIPYTLYERDDSFDARSQGYGLTLQQASKEMDRFGLHALADGVVSTRHVVHTTDGQIIGEWGMRKWIGCDTKKIPRRTNIHIPRQSLRAALLKMLPANTVQWNHLFTHFQDFKNNEIEINFKVNGKVKTAHTNLLVGADGIRSTVRSLLIEEGVSPLQYLGCIVILGICPLSDLADTDSPLLDSETVFQTANGKERIYMMPYTKDSIMWQLSFPMPEEEAIALSVKGPHALKKEAGRRTKWHDPIPQILSATKTSLISGYPVYDREILKPELLGQSDHVTLLGDAAHPMSPFKGQGANQALLDALFLAQIITKNNEPDSHWRETGLREAILNAYELEMITRTASKVKDSAAAAKFLHSDIVLQKGDEPRGRRHLIDKDANTDPQI